MCLNDFYAAYMTYMFNEKPTLKTKSFKSYIHLYDLSGYQKTTLNPDSLNPALCNR
jgi:hypothetical protein